MKVKGAGSSPFRDSPTPRCPPVALEATRRADRRCSSNCPAAAEGCLFHEAYPGPSVLIKNKIPLTVSFETVATGVSRWSVLAIQARLPVWPLVGDLDQGRYFARIDFLSRMSFPGSRLGLDLLRIGSLVGANGPFPCRFKIVFFFVLSFPSTACRLVDVSKTAIKNPRTLSSARGSRILKNFFRPYSPRALLWY